VVANRLDGIARLGVDDLGGAELRCSFSFSSSTSTAMTSAAPAIDAAATAHSFVFIVDRLKDMIISGGENVYSTEPSSSM
jgi:acyl-CoA synthetase (AMP-forming)/AMP-acid ligase II